MNNDDPSAKEFSKVLQHTEAFTEIEVHAVATLSILKSPLIVPGTRVCCTPSCTTIVSTRGHAFTTFFRTFITNAADGVKLLAAGCTVLHELHALGMLHLEAKPDNFVVLQASPLTPSKAVTVTLQNNITYSVHLADFETLWCKNQPGATKEAFNKIAADLALFNYQSHSWYEENFALGVKFDMHAFLIGFACFLISSEIKHKTSYKAIFDKCVLLANLDSNPDHVAKAIYSEIDQQYFNYFLLDFEAEVATPLAAAEAFLELA